MKAEIAWLRSSVFPSTSNDIENVVLGGSEHVIEPRGRHAVLQHPLGRDPREERRPGGAFLSYCT
ncbi:MAG: hypothetical protein K1Y01_17225 [Vicinamibacteria bacterium]|nr:hypothetical protein [Vicinamibacteria bacterium]